MRKLGKDMSDYLPSHGTMEPPGLDHNTLCMLRVAANNAAYDGEDVLVVMHDWPRTKLAIVAVTDMLLNTIQVACNLNRPLSRVNLPNGRQIRFTFITQDPMIFHGLVFRVRMDPKIRRDKPVGKKKMAEWRRIACELNRRTNLTKWKETVEETPMDERSARRMAAEDAASIKEAHKLVADRDAAIEGLQREAHEARVEMERYQQRHDALLDDHQRLVRAEATVREANDRNRQDAGRYRMERDARDCTIVRMRHDREEADRNADRIYQEKDTRIGILEGAVENSSEPVRPLPQNCRCMSAQKDIAWASGSFGAVTLMGRDISRERSIAFHAINTERDYQDKRWPESLEHELDAFALYIVEYARQLQAVAGTTDDPAPRLDAVRKVAALAVACMEAHGAPPRDA